MRIPPRAAEVSTNRNFVWSLKNCADHLLMYPGVMHLTVLDPNFLMEERGNSTNFLWAYPGWQRRCEAVSYILEIILVQSKIVLVLPSEHF